LLGSCRLPAFGRGLQPSPGSDYPSPASSGLPSDHSTHSDGWLFPSSRRSYSAFLFPSRPASPDTGNQSTELVGPREPSQHPIRANPSGIRPLVLRRRQGLCFSGQGYRVHQPLHSGCALTTVPWTFRPTECGTPHVPREATPYYTGLRSAVLLPLCPCGLGRRPTSLVLPVALAYLLLGL
jgi:hypothetical protein